MPTLSLIIPTIGRPTLARSLLSVRRQEWRAGDEVLLIGDGVQPVARSLWEQFHLPGRYIEHHGEHGAWGHHVRNAVNDQRLAAGTHLMALDDDDELATGAVATVRAAIAANPALPHLFRMEGDACKGRVWRTKEIAFENVGTPCLVTPNDPAKLGRYLPYHGGDVDFIRETCGFYPSIVWREEVIYLVRPKGMP